MIRDRWRTLVGWAIALGVPLAAAPAADAGGALGVHVVIGTATGAPGGLATFAVTLETDVEVAGTQNDISFTPAARIAARPNGRPDCRLGPHFAHSAPSFAFRPTDCDPASSCTTVRALVLSLNNVDGIPDGTLLYTCSVAIAADVQVGSYPLTISNVGAADLQGTRVAAIGRSGSVVVEVPTATPTDTPAATRTPRPTATATPRPPSPGEGGCAITPGAPRAAWGLLLPVAAAWVRRRRR